MQQSGSQYMLESLEHANLFVVSLDSRRQWYRYHALFAEALQHQLGQTRADLVPILHDRASRWYAEHDQITEAILHAFKARQWQWAADLIEQRRLSMMSLTWGVGKHEMVLLRQWLEQLPADIVQSRPRLCLACCQLLWAVAPLAKLQAWFDAAEATLTASLTTQTNGVSSTLAPQARQEQENLLGEIIAFRAILQSYHQDGQRALPLCQRALALLSADNLTVRAHVTHAQLLASYVSSANDAGAAIEYGFQASALAQAARQMALAILVMGSTVLSMLGAGRLHEAQQLALQATQLGRQLGGLPLPEAGWPAILQAEILREWNQLDAAMDLAREALSLCQ
jgi:LuxR family maltose regulon positive regulatory protein